MYAYVLASARDAPWAEWRNLTSAHLHVSQVGGFVRLDSRTGHNLHTRLLGCEMSIRVEWTRVQQAQPVLSITDIIHIVAQRHTVWPMEMRFRSPHINKYAWKGGEKGGGDLFRRNDILTRGHSFTFNND